MTDAIDMSYIEALLRATVQDHKDIVLARQYHAGTQQVYLTERVREFLALHDNTFRLNVCRGVVSAVTDELNVLGFDTDETAAEDGSKPIAMWADAVWASAGMETIQDDVHEAALRDREAFVIVYWDEITQMPRFICHNRYTTTEAGGNGQGAWIIYENDDPNQPAICAVNQWVETIVANNGGITTRTRRTLYYPDRIEKWMYTGGWQHFAEEGVVWPIPWLRPGGQPRGIPMFHFRNKGLRPEAWDAIPMQDVINKLLVDIVGTADAAGFPLLVAFGFFPTSDGLPAKSDGSNVMKIEPMRILGSTKPHTEASMAKIEGSDPTQMMTALKDMVLLTAMVTDTPPSRFNTSHQIAAKDTLKEQEKPLLKKAADRRASFGQVWEQCINMARMLANDFGAAGIDEKIVFSTMWQHSESYDALEQKMKFGVPQERIWEEMGYSQREIIEMKKMPQYRLAIEKLLWDVVSTAGDAVPLEMLLLRLGFTQDDLKTMGTQRMAEIALQQEDVVPPTGQ